MFQRNTALNLEHGTLLISILEYLLPDTEKKVEDNVAGRLGQCLDSIQVATRFFELKTTVLDLTN